MEIISNAYWEQGSRKLQEDSVIFEHVRVWDKDVVMAIVADGIGSLSEGNTASGFLVESLNKLFFEKIVPKVDSGCSFTLLKRMIYKHLYSISDEFQRYANIKEIELGTTCSFILIIKRRYLIFNLGDSGVFLCRRNKITPMVKMHINGDHSINRCVGSFGFFEPYIKSGWLLGEVAVLVASDGFYKGILNGDYAYSGGVLEPSEIVSESQVGKRLKECAMAGRQKGIKDNSSAVYIKIGG